MNQEVLQGTLKRIVFQKEEFHIAQLETENGLETILGDMYQVACDTFVIEKITHYNRSVVGELIIQ
ncbi:hypothetical protein GGQ84_002552 [Desulfitispora alkaliphila]|uniref:hypothetical protein n=1 Tax=Desulfitispora alkaliphila TaxID=622674 RepID=UPI003D1AFC3B